MSEFDDLIDDESPWADIDPLNQKFPATENTPGVTEEVKKLLDDDVDPHPGPRVPVVEPEYLKRQGSRKKKESVPPMSDLRPETIRLRKAMTREQAVARGKALGEHEADSRQEVGERKDERVARAMTYAAWEWDGKPASSESQRKEFGVTQAQATGSLDRAMFGRLIKKGKQEEPEKKKKR